MEIPARHVRKGDCIIRDVVPGGRVLVFVDYPDLGLTHRPACLDELVDRRTGGPISLDAPPPREAPPAAASAVPPWQQARQTLLALRLGQPTFESVNELSVGLEEVKDACKWAIARAQTGQISFLVFESPYGMGKSHALGYLKIRAREAAMATGSVVLDGMGVSLCLPISLIGALAHAIEYPEATASDGLPQRLAGLVLHREADKLSVAGAELLHGALENLQAEHVEDPDRWEVIEDYLSLERSASEVGRHLGVRVGALRAHLREARPVRSADLLREWAQACTVTGARGGLTVLFDEADVDYGQRGRTRGEIDQRTGLLQALRRSADGGPRGGSYGRLVVAMGITPGAGEQASIEELRNALGLHELKKELGLHLRVVRLRELTVGELRELGWKTVQLYQRAYGIDGVQEARLGIILERGVRRMERALGGHNPRSFIRHLLEELDVLYG